jgi:hypothetical protein
MDFVNIFWSHHGAHRTEGFADFFINNQLTDCVLIAEDRYIYAHKVILAASSPYFYNLFNARQSVAYEIYGVTFEALCTLIEFIYTGKVQVLNIQIAEFIKVCNFLQVNGVEDISVSVVPVPTRDPLVPTPSPSPTSSPRRRHPRSIKKCINCCKSFSSTKRFKNHRVGCDKKQRREGRARRRLEFATAELMEVN